MLLLGGTGCGEEGLDLVARSPRLMGLLVAESKSKQAAGAEELQG